MFIFITIFLNKINKNIKNITKQWWNRIWMEIQSFKKNSRVKISTWNV